MLYLVVLEETFGMQQNMTVIKCHFKYYEIKDHLNQHSEIKMK